MRVTYRHHDVQQYWNNRWDAVAIDGSNVNTETYPAKYAELVMRGTEGRVLEAGCGAGRLLRYYAARGVDITGIDFIDSVIAKLKSVDPGLKVETADIRSLRFADGQFRTVLAFGLYHNLHGDIDQAVAETYRVLEPGGRVCASFRADNLQTRLSDWLADRRAASKSREGGGARQFHKMNLSRGEFQQLFARAGFEIERIIPVENMPLLYKFRLFRARAHKDFNESLGRREGYRLSLAGRFVQWMLVHLLPDQFCNVYVLIARRPDRAR